MQTVAVEAMGLPMQSRMNSTLVPADNSDVSSGPEGYRQEAGVDAQTRCNCDITHAPDAFTCDKCGQYVGGAEAGAQDFFAAGVNKFEI